MLDEKLENQIIMLIKSYREEKELTCVRCDRGVYTKHSLELTYLQWQELCQQLFDTIKKYERDQNAKSN